MRRYGLGKVHLFFACFIFVLVIIVIMVIMIIKKNATKDDNLGVLRKDSGKEVGINELNNVQVEDDGLVTGADVIAKYSEVKNEPYAFLVATTSFLEEDKGELIGSERYPYFRYVVSKGNLTSTVDVYTENGLHVPLCFVNYNAVLYDSCLYDIGSGSYEVSLGFLEERLDNVGETNLNSYLPLKQSKSPNIYTIREDSYFASKLVYNENGSVIGYAYIEQ